MAVNDSPTPGRDTRSRPPIPEPKRSPSGVRRPDPQFEPPLMSVEGIRRGCLGSAASKVILGLLLLVFAGGVIFTGLGSNGFGGINGSGNLGGGSIGTTNSNETAATVGSDTVTVGQVNQALGNALDSAQQYGYPIDTGQLLFYRQNTLQGLTRRLALVQNAHKQGFNPSSDDIEQSIVKQVDAEIKAQEGENPTAFRRQIEAGGKTVDQVRADAVEKTDRDAAAQKWAIDKLEAKVRADNKVTPADYTRSQTKLNVQQIVIQPTAPQLPIPGAKAAVTRAGKPAETEDHTRTRAENLMKQLGASPTAAQFAALAKAKSDDLITKSRGGDLGFKLPTQLGLPIPVGDELTSAANASKNLIGPIQDPTTKYFYILHVTGRKLDLPKDYAKKKDQLLKAFEATRDNDAWQKYQEKISKATKVDISDPAVLAYQAQNPTSSMPTVVTDQTRAGIIENYEAALAGTNGKYASAILLQLAKLYLDNKQFPKAVESLTAATKGDPDNINARLQLVNALQTNKQTKEALIQLGQASQSLERNPPQSSPFSMGGNSSNPADDLHRQIAFLYDTLDKKALAQKELTKIKPAAPSGMPGGLGGIQGLPPGVKVLPAR